MAGLAGRDALVDGPAGSGDEADGVGTHPIANTARTSDRDRASIGMEGGS
jgi:hypothetical protein